MSSQANNDRLGDRPWWVLYWPKSTRARLCVALVVLFLVAVAWLGGRFVDAAIGSNTRARELQRQDRVEKFMKYCDDYGATAAKLHEENMSNPNADGDKRMLFRKLRELDGQPENALMSPDAVEATKAFGEELNDQGYVRSGDHNTLDSKLRILRIVLLKQKARSDI